MQGVQHICSALTVRGRTLMARSLPQACLAGREQRRASGRQLLRLSAQLASVGAGPSPGSPGLSEQAPQVAKGGPFTWILRTIAAETELRVWCVGGCPAVAPHCVCAVSVPPHRLPGPLQDPSNTPGTKDSSPPAWR